jgi:hypothetical protein
VADIEAAAKAMPSEELRHFTAINGFEGTWRASREALTEWAVKINHNLRRDAYAC